MKLEFAFELLSKHRTTLMGIAIIEVMVGHFLQWINFSTDGHPLLGFFISRAFSLVHVPGFIMLSGLGLYYSFCKDNNVMEFYKRRIKRMWIPFIVMALIFVSIVAYLNGGMPLDKYIGQITSLGYWFPGKSAYVGSWYIAMSLLLYALFPVFFFMLFDSNGNLKLNFKFTFIAIVVIWGVGAWALSYFCPEYYKKVYLAPPHGVGFVIGMVWGYFCSKSMRFNAFKYIALMLMLFVAFFVLSRFDRMLFVFADYAVFMVTIPLVGAMIHLLKSRQILKGLVKIWDWSGKYSLELYIMHLMLHNITVKTFEAINGPIYIERERGIFLVAVLTIVIAYALSAPMHKFTTYVAGRLIK